VLGFEARGGDSAVIDLVRRAVHDAAEERRVTAERTFLARMGGSCQTPLAAHAIEHDGSMRLVGMCGMPDGSRLLREEVTGAPADAAQLGVLLAEALLARGAAEILAATK